MDISKTMSFTTRGNRCLACGKPIPSYLETCSDSVCTKLRHATGAIGRYKGKRTDYDTYGFCGRKEDHTDVYKAHKAVRQYRDPYYDLRREHSVAVGNIKV